MVTDKYTLPTVASALHSLALEFANCRDGITGTDERSLAYREGMSLAQRRVITLLQSLHAGDLVECDCGYVNDRHEFELEGCPRCGGVC